MNQTYRIGAGHDFDDLNAIVSHHQAAYPYDPTHTGPSQPRDEIWIVTEDIVDAAGIGDSSGWENGGHDVTIQGVTESNGMPRGTIKVTLAQNTQGFFNLNYGGTLTIRNLHFEQAAANDVNNGVGALISVHALDVLIDRCLFNPKHDHSTGAIDGSALRGLQFGNPGLVQPDSIIVKSCKFWESFYGVYYDLWDDPPEIVLENCTFYNGVYGAYGNGSFRTQATATVRNCASFDNESLSSDGVDYDTDAITTIENSASSDATGSAGLGLLDANECFVSLNETDAGFLALGEGGTVDINASGYPRIGKAPFKVRYATADRIDWKNLGPLAYAGVGGHYAKNDIAGIVRGLYSKSWSIGCHEPTIREMYSEQVG